MQAARSFLIFALALYVSCLAVPSCSAVRLNSSSWATRIERLQNPSVKESPYGHKLTHNWSIYSFQQRWEAFSNAVPHDELQEFGESPMTCRPAMFPSEGREHARHLVILLHGYLGCPGSFNSLLPALLAPEFLIIVPTLPGHGRTYNSRPRVNGHNEYFDDLSQMPTGPQDYNDFAAAVTMLAQSFKQEHPQDDTVIALVGHSLGGFLASKIAIDNPQVFNRVLAMNPLYDVPWSIRLAKKILEKAKGPTDRISLASLERLDGDTTGCEKRREWNSDGGYCQFTLQHNAAIDELSKTIYKKEWRLGKGTDSVTLKFRDAFTQLKSFQMIATKNDAAVDNTAIIDFMVAAQRIDTDIGNQRSMCFLPKGYTHNYIAQSQAKDGPIVEREFWFEHRLNEIVAEYISTGLPISAVTQSKKMGYGYCMPKENKSVGGAHLTILPAEQQKTEYGIADVAPIPTIHVATIVYQGVAKKDSRSSSKLQERHIEFLKIGRDVLLVTRLSRNDNPKIYFVSSSNAERDREKCVKLKLVYLQSAPQPLLPQLTKARQIMKEKSYSVRHVCEVEQGFIDILCDREGLLSCESAPGQA